MVRIWAMMMILIIISFSVAAQLVIPTPPGITPYPSMPPPLPPTETPSTTPSATPSASATPGCTRHSDCKEKPDNPCTVNDCDLSTKTCKPPRDKCNKCQTCSSNGRCSAKNCDDGNICTTDTCDLATGECTNECREGTIVGEMPGGETKGRCCTQRDVNGNPVPGTCTKLDLDDPNYCGACDRMCSRMDVGELRSNALGRHCNIKGGCDSSGIGSGYGCYSCDIGKNVDCDGVSCGGEAMHVEWNEGCTCDTNDLSPEDRGRYEAGGGDKEMMKDYRCAPGRFGNICDDRTTVNTWDRIREFFMRDDVRLVCTIGLAIAARELAKSGTTVCRPSSSPTPTITPGISPTVPGTPTITPGISPTVPETIDEKLISGIGIPK